jgi:hypothetical protein
VCSDGVVARDSGRASVLAIVSARGDPRGERSAVVDGTSKVHVRVLRRDTEHLCSVTSARAWTTSPSAVEACGAAV